ncbi:MAG: glycosyltransferase family 4 protein [Myxococcota bacterium]
MHPCVVFLLVEVALDAPPSALIVDTAAEWRGGQVQTLHLVQGMQDRGWPVRVACPMGSPLWQALDRVAVPRLAIPTGRDPRTILRLGRAPASLLVAQTSHAHSLCAVLRRPLVVHRRVDFLPSGGWKYRRPEAFVAVSDAVRQILVDVGVSADRVMVVHDGVAPLPVAAPALDGPAVLAVGARVAHKGHQILCAAAPLLPGVDIGVAGAGPLTWPGVRWLGRRDDIPALLAAAQVFVHPSVEEGMGQAVVEAMLAGVPVVVSDAGGLPEVVGDAGIIVPKSDPTALAAGIRRALRGEHPSLERARRRARERFSVGQMVEKTLAVYQQVSTSDRGNAR